MTVAEQKEALARWREHCEHVQKMTALSGNETDSEKRTRVTRLQNNYSAFCEYYFPHYLTQYDKTTGEALKTVHNAPFHNVAAKKVKETPNLKAVL